MLVSKLIAALSTLPPDAVARVFSAEAQDWMPITDIDQSVILGLGTRIDLRAYLSDDDEAETVYPTSHELVRQIEKWLGQKDSCEMAERVFAYMREQGMVTHNGNGLVIERDTNVFQIAADLTGQDDCAQGVHSWTGETGLLPPDTRCTRCGEEYGHPD